MNSKIMCPNCRTTFDLELYAYILTVIKDYEEFKKTKTDDSKYRNDLVREPIVWTNNDDGREGQSRVYNCNNRDADVDG